VSSKANAAAMQKFAAGTEEVRRLMIHQTGAESMEEETDNFERILQIMKPSREFHSSEIKIVTKICLSFHTSPV
jgi:hypothetical protein